MLLKYVLVAGLAAQALVSPRPCLLATCLHEFSSARDVLHAASSGGSASPSLERRAVVTPVLSCSRLLFLAYSETGFLTASFPM